MGFYPQTPYLVTSNFFYGYKDTGSTTLMTSSVVRQKQREGGLDYVILRQSLVMSIEYCLERFGRSLIYLYLGGSEEVHGRYTESGSKGRIVPFCVFFRILCHG